LFAGEADGFRAGSAGGVFVVGKGLAAGGWGVVVDLDGLHAWVSVRLGVKRERLPGAERLRQPWNFVYASILRN